MDSMNIAQQTERLLRVGRVLPAIKVKKHVCMSTFCISNTQHSVRRTGDVAQALATIWWLDSNLSDLRLSGHSW